MSNQTFTPFTSIFTLAFIRVALFIGLIILLYNFLWLPAIMVLFLLVITESTWWWSRLGLKKIIVARKLSPKRIFLGEKTNVKIKISNNKFLPSIIEYQQKLVLGLAGSNNKTVVLPRYATHTENFQIQGILRGYYVLEDLLLYSRDGLGLYYSQLILSEKQEFFVYPKLIAFADLEIKAADLIGERPDRRTILPDPLRTAGLRDYTPDMPARLIHWKASINKDQLLAKLIEPSADYKLLVVIDLEDFFTQGDVDGFEKSLSVAASLAVWAEEKRIPLGLLVNASQKCLSGTISIPISQGANQTVSVLEKLARAEFNPLGTLPDLLQKESKNIPWGTTLLVMGTEILVTLPRGVRNTIYYPIS